VRGFDSRSRSVDIAQTIWAGKMNRSMRSWCLRCTAVTVVLAAASASAAEPSPAQDAVRYLAANCTTCHAMADRDQRAIPRIAGLAAAYFLEQMRLFRAGQRPATVMQQIARGYSEEQTEFLAAYFSSLTPK
jgi:cytochrome subunit of sulfide dehydrogenase